MTTWNNALGLAALTLFVASVTPACTAEATAEADEGAEAIIAPLHPWESCSKDADVVAVPKVGCCDFGEKAAVNKRHVAAYEASFDDSTCGDVCAAVIYKEMRQPLCVGSRATMVEIDQIACGGHTPNPHACPQGYSCQGAGLPVDAPGRCIQDERKDGEPCGDSVCDMGSECQWCGSGPACVPHGAKC